MKLEVVVIGVSDVDRAKTFYEKLGWRLDADFAKGDDFRVIQFTPHNSECSIMFGKGVTSPKPGAVKSLTLAVEHIEAARDDLLSRGLKVSEISTLPVARSTTRQRTHASAGATPKIVRIFRSRRSRIRMGTVTCSR